MNTKRENELKSVLTYNQKKKIKFANVELNGQQVDLVIKLRYDDECRNGHNTFSITGTIYEEGRIGERNIISCGCVHDEIKKIVPEYAKYIKWHLVSSDGPLHYIANTLYHARDRDCWGFKKGEVRETKNYIQFGDFPITSAKPQKFIEFLKKQGQFKTFIIEEVSHVKDSHIYSPKYTFKGFPCEWHECPFDSKREAEEWRKALKHSVFKVVAVPVSWGEGKEPDLESARNSAIAPNATLEQLQSEEWLKARLPKLQQEFKQAMEELGFTY